MTNTNRPRLTPYQRIVRAGKSNRGVRLSWEECWQLGVMDDAIGTRAALDDEAQKIRKLADRISRQQKR